MKRVLFPLVLLLIAAVAAGCAQGFGAASAIENEDMAIAAEPLKLSAEQAYELINGERPVVVVDVRTAEEYAERHIAGAVLLPIEQLGDKPPAALPVLNAEILVYCRSGNRSAQAAAMLTELGYTNVSDFGGINDWPYETESGEYMAEEKSGAMSSFSAYDLNGMAVDESIFAAYPLTMVNVWATFCGNCLREMPDLAQLSEQYAERGMQVVGIAADVRQSFDGSFSPQLVETAQSLVAQTGADYTHLLPTADLVQARLKNVSAVPETFFVNSKGEIVGSTYVGGRSIKSWEAIIDKLLAGVAAE